MIKERAYQFNQAFDGCEGDTTNIVRLLYLMPLMVKFIVNTDKSKIDELFSEVFIDDEKQLPIAIFLGVFIVKYGLIEGEWSNGFL